MFKDDVTTCLQSYKHTLTDLLPSVDGWPELHPFPNTELHISLSRTMPIMFHWIEPLTTALRDKLRETTRWVKCHIYSSNVLLKTCMVNVAAEIHVYMYQMVIIMYKSSKFIITYYKSS